MIFGLALTSTGHVIMGIAGPAIPLLVAGWLIACVGTGIAASSLMAIKFNFIWLPILMFWAEQSSCFSTTDMRPMK